jgi:CBS domain containing-hemolysin-like protein
MGESGLAILLQLFVVLGLVFINAFFVAAEFSLVTVRRSRVEELVNSGSRSARLVAGILKDLDTVISSTQLGITMASLALGWVAEPFLAHLLTRWLSLLPEPVAFVTANAIAAALAFMIITVLHIVLGELVPKSLALQRTEKTALGVAVPLLVFERLMHPFLVVLNRMGNLVLHAIGVRGSSTAQLVHSEEELRILLDESQESGVLEEEETEIIQRIFDFTDMTARQVMVPRTEMVCLPVDAQLSDVLDVVLREEHSRFPVYKTDLDDIVGVVKVKEILPFLCGQPESFDLKQISRSPLVVPENITLSDLLSQFRRQRSNMAILIDEFGGTAGLVTISDLLEEIVGDVSDGLEEHEIEIDPQPDGSTLINGKVLLTAVNEQFGLDLTDPHYVTLGGLVFSRIGRRPKMGDEAIIDGRRMRVESLDGLRVAMVRLQPAEEPAGSIRQSDESES